jgi:hypothetical protein
MFQILKNNYIDIFCYSCDPRAAEYFPIDYAQKFVPNWWKKIPSKLYEPSEEGVPEEIAKRRSKLLPTMKRCPGFIEHYKRGIILPMWMEIELVVSKGDIDATCSFGDPNETFSFHPSHQYGSFLDVRKWLHVKIDSPWVISTDKPLNFVYAQPHYNFQDLNNKLFIPNSYDEYQIQHSTEIQMFVNVERDGVINFRPGMPMVHKIPLTEKKIKLHTEYNPNMFFKLKNNYSQSHFEGRWYYLKKHINSMKDKGVLD